MLPGVSKLLTRTGSPLDRKEMAFQTILKNRTLHGGILAAGSGFLKRGEAGKGIRSRWYPQTLRRRLSAIKTVRGRLTFIEGDALGVIREHMQDDGAVFLDRKSVV